ncbi:MAG: hypothetical protein ABW076_15835 [Candidatus Thiodiazotropha sp.]
MCITIPSSPNVARSRSFPLWNRLAASPARLLGFAALLSLAVWGLTWLLAIRADPLWMAADLAFSILPMGLFGILLSRLPQWLKVTPLRAVNYGILFYLLLTAQLLFHLPILFGAQPGWLHGLLSLAAWLLLLKQTGQFYAATYQRNIGLERGMRVLLIWGGAVATLGYLGLLLTDSASLSIITAAGLSYLLPLSALVLARIVKSDPRIH